MVSAENTGRRCCVFGRTTQRARTIVSGLEILMVPVILIFHKSLDLWLGKVQILIVFVSS
jgi:hypothetical protein